MRHSPRAERNKLTDLELEQMGITRDDLDFDTENEDDEEEEEYPEEEEEEEVVSTDKGKGVDRGTNDQRSEQANQGSSANSGESKAEDLSALTKEQRELLDYLDEVNGQDAYSNEDAALGKVSQKEYLVLPVGFVIPAVAPKDVGAENVHRLFTKQDLANIYVLNKEASPESSHAVLFALLRMESVKMGWVAGQREIRRAVPPTTAMNTFLTDLAAHKESIGKLRRAAFLIPLVAEHTFRTMGHHYLTSAAADYEKRYRSTLRACLSEDCHGLLPSGIQYHSLFHWVSPQRARDVLISQLATKRIPDALTIRANASPAGTALITTSAAVISALKAANLLTTLKDAAGYDFEKIQKVTNKIKARPTEYHKTYYAYGHRALSTAQINEVEDAKQEASRFAPVAQAFIDAMFQDAALGNAKALKKHADENPVLVRRATRFFKAIGRKEAKDFKELFSQTAES